MDNADLVFVAYGSTARIVKTAMDAAWQEGLRVGMIRPITLWPFPTAALARAAGHAQLLTVEMSAGLMVDDVRLAINGQKPVYFYGRTGGMIHTGSHIG